MDQAIRYKFSNAQATQCRKLTGEVVAQVLQGQFGIHAAGKDDEVHVEDEAPMTHWRGRGRECRKDFLDHFEHIKARGYKPRRPWSNWFGRSPSRT